MTVDVLMPEHGRLYALRLDGGTLLPLVAWRQTLGMRWQFLDGCPNEDVCLHGRHAHLVAWPDGRLRSTRAPSPVRTTRMSAQLPRG